MHVAMFNKPGRVEDCQVHKYPDTKSNTPKTRFSYPPVRTLAIAYTRNDTCDSEREITSNRACMIRHSHACSGAVLKFPDLSNIS